MIIIGYPGIGKSTVSKDDYRFIDLDSTSKSTRGGVHIKRWEVMYAKFAEYLSEQGYFVFVSSHPEVQKALTGSTEIVYVCYPDKSLRDKWVKKLADRYGDTGTTKDHRAFQRASEHFYEDILTMADSDFGKIVLPSMSYNLKRMILEAYDVEVQKEMGERS